MTRLFVANSDLVAPEQCHFTIANWLKVLNGPKGDFVERPENVDLEIALRSSSLSRCATPGFLSRSEDGRVGYERKRPLESAAVVYARRRNGAGCVADAEASGAAEVVSGTGASGGGGSNGVLDDT